jgi:flagellar protein FlbD
MWRRRMILLTSLSGSEFYLNEDLIVKMEALPDTVITLTDGKTMRVGENPKEIIDRIVSYKRKIFAGNLEV